MERPEEEQYERETQALSTTASHASHTSSVYPLDDEDPATEHVTGGVESPSASHESLMRRLLEGVVPPAGGHGALLDDLLKRAVASPASSRDRLMADLRKQLLHAALPTPTSSQELRPGVITFRRAGSGEGDRPLTPDTEYLRRHLGEPLVAALAEVAAKRPRDPIHYLGHWLFRWRADSELQEAKKQKAQQLHQERERVAAERRAREEEERRAQVLEIAGDMIEEAFGRSIWDEPSAPSGEGEGEGEEEEDLPFT